MPPDDPSITPYGIPCAWVPAGPPAQLSPNEELLVLALTRAVSDSLRSRGVDPAELALARATALARQLAQLVDDPQDSALVERAQASTEMLAANLAAVLGSKPRLS